MNILIPHSWLLEHLETKAKPAEIQKYLSLCGPSVERIYEREGEAVYDIEVTTNRVDSMSVRGMAREAAVILTQFGIPSELKPLSKSILPSTQHSQLTTKHPLPKINNDPDLCRRVICVVLKNVRRTPTPDWMAKRLTQTEMSVHDSVIDITNYITHELGHPCHAFDYDKLMAAGEEVNIVEAKKGEKFTTLDGESFVTVGGEVVFKNGQNKIIDLPSIKGTANTSIDEKTQNVLLLLESIRADKVRFASMTHAIRTTAAQLMEKNVDPHLAKEVILRGIELYEQLCQAELGSEIYDDFPHPNIPQPIKISADQITNYLGITLPSETIIKILTALECQVKFNTQNQTLNTQYLVTPPTFRPDLTIPADIVEEIARIYGYHNLPSVVMPTAIPMIKPEGVNFDLENKAKTFLSLIGYQELYTYSMVSAEVAQASGYRLNHHLKLQNQLTDDKVYLRRSIIPSLLEILAQNPLTPDLQIFELAHVYEPKKGQLPDQILHLSLISPKPYRLVRGDLEALLKQFYLPKVVIKPFQASAPFAQLAQVLVETKDKSVCLGQIGILTTGQIAVDLLMSELIKVAATHPHYQPIINTSLIKEDLTFTLPYQIAVAKIITAIQAVSPLIIKVELKEIYQQNLTFTLSYQHRQENLTSLQLAPIRQSVTKLVTSKFDAQLVGKI